MPSTVCSPKLMARKNDEEADVAQQSGYWSKPSIRRISRRGLLAVAGGGLSLSGSALIACSPAQKAGGGRSSSGGQSGPATTSSPPQTGGTFNWYLNNNPLLDPHRISTGAQAIGGVYSRLFRFKTGADPNAISNHELESDLGVSIESPDAVTWTVKLRPDAKFHDIPPVNGHAVEAEDVKATFSRALDSGVSNPNRGAVSMIDPAQIQTPDASTVVFKIKYPYAPFRTILASPVDSWIVPREAWTGGFDPAKQMIGSGPFLADSLAPDVAFTFRRNPNWFEKGRPYADNVRLAIIPDRSQQLAQFAAGNLDELLLDNPFELDGARQNSPRALVYKAANASPGPLNFQLGDPSSIFQDIRVRRAFSMAIDRETLGKVVYNGEAEQMLYVPAYMGKWALRVGDLAPSVQQYYKYNPAEAKKMLEAAGQTNLQFKITYPNALATPSFVKQAESIGNMLNAIGVKITFVEVDFNKDWIDAGKGIRQGYYPKDTVVYATVASYTDADEFLFNYFDSKSTTSEERVSDPAVDAMIEKERTVVNEDERLKSVQEIERYIADKMYPVPTVGTYQWILVNPRVQNYEYSSSSGKMTESYAKLWLKS